MLFNAILYTTSHPKGSLIALQTLYTILILWALDNRPISVRTKAWTLSLVACHVWLS